MDISLADVWAHRNQRAAQCPACGSERLRLSRRKYDGLLAAWFQLKPMKCADCSAYVPIAGKYLAGSVLEADSLRVPFGPDGEEPVASESQTAVRITTPVRNRAAVPGACPLCGSTSVRRAVHGPLESYVSRLNAKDLYRCLSCNAAFRRTNFLKLGFMAFVFLATLAGFTYLAVGRFGHTRPSGNAPKIKRPVPAASPPVFR